MTDIDTTTDTTIDKLDSHHRQQLSALLDGALSPDEARFLLRRLQHDDELSACLERWQLAGDVLRGQVGEILPTGFSGRVAAAVANESTAATIPAKTRSWFSGGAGMGAAALAASVIVAVLVFQQMPQQFSVEANIPVAVSTPDSTPAQDATIATGMVESLPRESAIAPVVASASFDASSTPVKVDRGSDRSSIATATVIAAAAAKRSRQQNEYRIATSAPTTSSTRSGLALVDSSKNHHPFATTALPQSRPWPRSPMSRRTLGEGGAANMFTASYDGARTTDGNSYYPFEPQTTKANRSLDLPQFIQHRPDRALQPGQQSSQDDAPNPGTP